MYQIAQFDKKDSHPIASEAFKGLAETLRVKSVLNVLIACQTDEQFQMCIKTLARSWEARNVRYL